MKMKGGEKMMKRILILVSIFSSLLQLLVVQVLDQKMLKKLIRVKK